MLNATTLFKSFFAPSQCYSAHTQNTSVVTFACHQTIQSRQEQLALRTNTDKLLSISITITHNWQRSSQAMQFCSSRTAHDRCTAATMWCREQRLSRQACSHTSISLWWRHLYYQINHNNKCVAPYSTLSPHTSHCSSHR